LYHAGQSFSNNNEDRHIYNSTSGDKEIPVSAYTSHNHKEDQGFVTSSQTRTQDKVVNSGDYRSSKSEENSPTCANFMDALSLTSSDSARLALLTVSAGEGLSFLNQHSGGNQDTSAFLNKSYSHAKRGQSESSMETESLNHKQNN
jgi:hypothetical protein